MVSGQWLMSNDKCQKSETRGQKSEFRNQKSVFISESTDLQTLSL